jgi:histidine phosphotransferase ChpT
MEDGQDKADAPSDLDLAALVASRICHDVISPVGAIANGLELLGEEQDEAMREAALDLIRNSARQASAKLQFCRLAFGAAGSAGAEIDLRDAEKVARGFVEGGKHRLSWDGPVAALPKDRVKLLLNLIALAMNALPRGGLVAVKIDHDPAAGRFEVRAQGEPARLNETVVAELGGANGHEVDSHTIQPHYAGRVARGAAMKIDAATDGADVVFAVTPA